MLSEEKDLLLHRGDNGVCSLCQGGLVWSEFSCRCSSVLVGSNYIALQGKVWAMIFPRFGAALVNGLQIQHSTYGSACTHSMRPTYIDIEDAK